MRSPIIPLFAILVSTGLVESMPKTLTPQTCIPGTVDPASLSPQSVNTLASFRLNVISQAFPSQSFVLSLVPQADRFVPTLSTLQTKAPTFSLNQGFLTYKRKVFGRSQIEDKSLLPKALFFQDKNDAQKATFEAVYICDIEGKRRRVLKGTVNPEGREPDLIVAIERTVGGRLFVPLTDKESKLVLGS